mgnify:CR=1 FL=1
MLVVPDLDSVPSSRVCPSCGRRVRTRSRVCRCGRTWPEWRSLSPRMLPPRPSPISPSASARAASVRRGGRRVPPESTSAAAGPNCRRFSRSTFLGDDQPLSESDFEEGFPTVLGVAAFMCCSESSSFIGWASRLCERHGRHRLRSKCSRNPGKPRPLPSKHRFLANP